MFAGALFRSVVSVTGSPAWPFLLLCSGVAHGPDDKGCLETADDAYHSTSELQAYFFLLLRVFAVSPAEPRSCACFAISVFGW